MRDLAERVGDVADLHHRAEHLRDAMAAQEVADERLAAGQRLVRDDVPGADEQLALLHDALDVVEAVGAHLQVVLERDRVAVEHEVLVVGVAVEQVEQHVEEADEAHAERLVREVPLAVPVRVRDDHELALSRGGSFAEIPMVLPQATRSRAPLMVSDGSARTNSYRTNVLTTILGRESAFVARDPDSRRVLAANSGLRQRAASGRTVPPRRWRHTGFGSGTPRCRRVRR